VSVAGHKTALTYGAAKIVLSPTLHHYIAGMTSGQITNTVQRIWYKADLDHDSTLNIVRKTAVSLIHQAHPKNDSKFGRLDVP